MSPTVLASVLSFALLSAFVVAQTAAANPQRPTRTVESVRPLERVKSDAAKLDNLLQRSLQRRGEAPLPLADDATFVRRAYLSIVGHIPSLKETEAFLADQRADKRDRLVDLLLDSPGRTSHFANFWFDLLRLRSRNQALSGEPFAAYIRESIQGDKPYDDFAREMLIAEGPAHKEGNGATGMLLRDVNMPQDGLANSVRLFLGTRIECAQCHNHPFEPWTQKEFYGMAAFFGGLRYRDEASLPNLVGLRAELANADVQVRQQAQNMLRRLNQGLDGSGTGVERLPKDYKYDDAKPGAQVLASTLFGPSVKLRCPEPARQNRRDQRRAPATPPIESRAALADWMTSPKNPLFAKVIANRMWARTFGAGVVDPIDDFKKDTAAVHPELFEQLEKLIVDLDFDLRQFERVLVHTQLFQRECQLTDDAGGTFTFRGPRLRRLTAEQMWDSLLTLVFDDLDERLRPMDERARPVYTQFAELIKADAKDLIEMVQQRRDPMAVAQQKQREEVRRQIAADQELQKRARPLLKELAEARRNGDLKKMQELAQQLENMGVGLGRRAGRGGEGDLQRASDLPQPANPNHLLRQFGQSNRETVDSAASVATVPQVLTLLNGFLDQRVLEGASALARDLSIAPDGERRVRIAFLTTLNREPTADELKDWRRTIAVNGANAIKDLVWVLCNSNEFRFQR
ncbi:MAG: DUF1549 and DUF1553 domain-containing protein [Planctomycetes bacterium]|nr:DUF1549 and DUF1553 domain-containing protein [Planctomycetota bacterium]MCC7399801.1 DUF1549 domain-containing protein [Planctomycetota bacterium]